MERIEGDRPEAPTNRVEPPDITAATETTTPTERPRPTTPFELVRREQWAYLEAFYRQLQQRSNQAGFASFRVFLLSLGVGIGAAVAGFFLAPIWFPDIENSGGVAAHRVLTARLAASLLFLIVPFVSTPFWLSNARVLRPVMVPGGILILIMITGGVALLLSYPKDLNNAGQVYVLAMAAGIASVLTASGKWAFDTVGAESKHASDQRHRMAERVHRMTTWHYAPMLRRAHEAVANLYDLRNFLGLSEQDAFVDEIQTFKHRTARSLILLLSEVRHLYAWSGSIYLTERGHEDRIGRLLVIIPQLMDIDEEATDELVTTVGPKFPPLPPDSAGEAGPPVLLPPPLTSDEFAELAAEDKPAARMIRELENRFDQQRVRTGLDRALTEFQVELNGAINQSHRQSYRSWKRSVTTSSQRTEERRLRIEWTRQRFYLEQLAEALEQIPSDYAARLEALIAAVDHSLATRDPVAAYSLLEIEAEEFAGDLLLLYRRSRPKIYHLCTSILTLLGARGSTRTRYAIDEIA